MIYRFKKIISIENYLDEFEDYIRAFQKYKYDKESKEDFCNDMLYNLSQLKELLKINNKL